MKIKSIRFYGLADVYNMHVEDTHSFSVEGGIIVHNCYDETRYACMSRPMTPRKKEPDKTKVQIDKERRAKNARRIRVT